MPDPRLAIAARVHALVGSRRADAGVRDAATPGLCPHGGAAWEVHGDFAAMMIGGSAALLTQMLDPASCAGVWDHSNFRADMAGRLRRTAQFVAATTFASADKAAAMIARVRRIHDHVTGTLPDGTPYAANDPDTLTFVHVAGADAFLRAFVRYSRPGWPGARQDAYFAETAEIARRLGARDVPESRAAVARYFRAVRPRLRADARSREIARVLLASRPDLGGAAPAARLLMDAGIDLLPGWAAELHRLHVPAWRRPLVRAGAGGLGQLLRASLAYAAERAPVAPVG
ncbi:histidine kinase [alpha proteobacterium AAP81b]|nr:histidine kinase [alpha proteobacterium AAP81b]